MKGLISKYSRLYDKIDLKDKKTVKNLLYHRAYFETIGFSSDGSAFNKIDSNHNTYASLIDIYADLDILIKECNFTEKNKRLLRLVESGYTINQIYVEFENYEKWSTLKMFDRIIERINEQQRKREVEKNDVGFTQWGAEDS